MDPTVTILRMAEIIARYEGTFQANTATIAQLQGELRDAKAALAECSEKKPARNGSAKAVAERSVRGPAR